METAKKKCTKCGDSHKEDEFPVMLTRQGGSITYRAHCKACEKRLSKHRRDIKKKHGNPPEWYACPICLRGEQELRGQTNSKSLWALDHNHDTGGFRGWLCQSCNRALGIFNDDVEFLKRAMEYLGRGDV